jgi:cytoskeletal protein RodZ
LLSVESVGHILKTAREVRGLSVSELARITKIPSSSIIALEENNFAALPAPVFVRGFIRALCREVGQDANDVLTVYETFLRESTLRDPFPNNEPSFAPLLFASGGADVSGADSHRGLQISHVLLLVLALATFIIAYVTAGVSTATKDGAPKEAVAPRSAPENLAVDGSGSGDGGIRGDAAERPGQLGNGAGAWPRGAAVAGPAEAPTPGRSDTFRPSSPSSPNIQDRP